MATNTDKALALVEAILPIAIGTIGIGVNLFNRLSATLGQARAEGRELSDAELASLAAETNALRDQVLTQLDALANVGG